MSRVTTGVNLLDLGTGTEARWRARKSDRFGRVRRLNPFDSCEIGDRPGDSSARWIARAERLHFREAQLEDRNGRDVDGRAAEARSAGNLRVARGDALGQASRREGPRLHDPPPDRRRRLRGGRAGDRPGERPRTRDVQVDAVDQRPRDLPSVARDRVERAAAGPPRITAIAARAGVHRRDEEEVARERRTRRRAHDRRRVSPRAAGVSLRARRGGIPAARPGRARRGARAKSRRASGAEPPPIRPAKEMPCGAATGKAALAEEPAAGAKHAGDANGSGSTSIASGASQAAGSRQAPREHRLAGSRRAEQQEVVAARRGDLGARFAPAWPATSRKSSRKPGRRRSRSPTGSGERRKAAPRRWATAEGSETIPITRNVVERRRLLRVLAAGTRICRIRVGRGRGDRERAADRPDRPSSASSPTSTRRFASAGRVRRPRAARAATGRSSAAPFLLQSAGARLTVTALGGKSETRVADGRADPVAASRTPASGSPTIEKRGQAVG